MMVTAISTSGSNKEAGRHQNHAWYREIDDGDIFSRTKVAEDGETQRKQKSSGYEERRHTLKGRRRDSGEKRKSTQPKESMPRKITQTKEHAYEALCKEIEQPKETLKQKDKEVERLSLEIKGKEVVQEYRSMSGILLAKVDKLGQQVEQNVFFAKCESLMVP